MADPTPIERASAVLERYEAQVFGSGEIWLEFVGMIAAAYMKPTTATAPESIAADAQRDAAYTAAAADALLAEYRKRWPK